MSTRFQARVPTVARASGTTVASLVIAVLILTGLGTVLLGFSIMVLLGILWGEFGWLAPIGFGPAFGIGFFGTIILLCTRAKVEAKSS